MSHTARISALSLLRRCGGFSLMELAIGLAAVGLMVGLMLQATTPEDPEKCYTATRARMNDMQGALERFAGANGRYPLPAANAQGRSVPTAASAGVTSVTLAGKEVVIGNFPYAEVGLPPVGTTPNYYEDCFGKSSTNPQYRYVVSTNLTNSTGYAAGKGAGVIQVTTNKNGGFSTNNASYALVSHGAIAGCSGNAGIVNCGTSDNIVYAFTPNKGTPGNNTGTATTPSDYFDDIVVVGSQGGTCSGDVTWGNNTPIGACSAHINSLDLGAKLDNVGTENSLTTGSATVTCGYDAATKTSKLTAVGKCGCKSGQLKTWGSSCSDSTTRDLLGTGDTELLNSTTPLGTATAVCNSGNLTTTSEICHAPCPAGTPVTWGTGNACSNTLPNALAGNGAVSGAITSLNGTGSATFTCTDGTATPNSGATCATGTWTGATCSASCNGVAGTWSGAQCTGGNGECIAADNPNGKSCSGTDACYAGTWSVGSCSASCGGGTVGAPTCNGGACDPATKPASGQACNPQACSVSSCTNLVTTSAATASGFRAKRVDATNNIWKFGTVANNSLVGGFPGKIIKQDYNIYINDVTVATLLEVHYDDWEIIGVNDKTIYIGPYNDESIPANVAPEIRMYSMESLKKTGTGTCLMFGKATNSSDCVNESIPADVASIIHIHKKKSLETSGTCFFGKATNSSDCKYGIELGISWATGCVYGSCTSVNRPAVKIDLKPYLHKGNNNIHVETAVGGGGESYFYLQLVANSCTK